MSNKYQLLLFKIVQITPHFKTLNYLCTRNSHYGCVCRELQGGDGNHIFALMPLPLQMAKARVLLLTPTSVSESKAQNSTSVISEPRGWPPGPTCCGLPCGTGGTEPCCTRRMLPHVPVGAVAGLQNPLQGGSHGGRCCHQQEGWWLVTVVVGSFHRLSVPPKLSMCFKSREIDPRNSNSQSRGRRRMTLALHKHPWGTASARPQEG